MFCPNCGAKCPDGTAFCQQCGTRLTPQAQPQTPAQPEPQAPQGATIIAPDLQSKPQPQPQPQPQPAYQPRPQAQPQPAYQPRPQAQPQPAYQPRPQAQPQAAYQQPRPAYQPQPQRQAAYSPVPQTKGRSKAPLIVTIVVALLVIAAAVVLLILKPWESGGSGGKSKSEKYEGAGVAEDVVTTFIKLDAKGIADLLPDEYYEFIGDANDMTKKEFKNYFIDTLEDALSEADYDPDDAKVKITVTGEDDYKKSELSEMEDAYDEIGIELAEAKIILADVTITIDGEKETLEDMEIPIIKVGKSWYLDAYNMDTLTDQLDSTGLFD